MLEIKKLSFNFDEQRVINNLTANFGVNKTVAIIGPSGCGKTTCLKLISGLLQPTSGEIVRHFSSDEVGYIFQDFCLLPWRTVEQNIALVLKNKRLPPSGKQQRIEKALSIIGLQSYANKYPYELSGGMQQRVGLARALVIKPKLLLMDEPFSAVDGQTRELLVEEFRMLFSRISVTRILVTHQIDDVLDLADELLILSKRPAELIDRLDVQQSLSVMGRERLKQQIWRAVRGHVKANELIETYRE